MLTAQASQPLPGKTVRDGAYYYNHVSEADELSHCNFPGFPAHINCLNDFADYLAATRKITREAAINLIQRSQSLYVGGWAGEQYRDFTEVLLETFRPVYDDITDDMVIDTYKQHGTADFFRMLSYPIPNYEDQRMTIEILSKRPHVDIVDYGCGLSQRNIALAVRLQRLGRTAKIYFLDIYRPLHWNFLTYLCNRYGIPFEFIEVSNENLYPELPPHDHCDNVSVLEHVREPLRVVENINRTLRPGGLFLAGAVDAVVEMMHISPNLKTVRDRLNLWGYRPIYDYYGAILLYKP